MFLRKIMLKIYPYISLGIVNILESVEGSANTLQLFQDYKDIIIFPLQAIILGLTIIKLLHDLKKRKLKK